MAAMQGIKDAMNTGAATMPLEMPTGMGEKGGGNCTCPKCGANLKIENAEPEITKQTPQPPPIEPAQGSGMEPGGDGKDALAGML